MFDSKPVLGQRINWTYPLSYGLVGCWVFNEQGGNFLTNLADDKIAIFSGPNQTDPFWDSDKVFINGSQSVISSTIKPFDFDGSMPFSAMVKYVTINYNSSQTIISNLMSGTGYKGWSLHLDDIGSGLKQPNVLIISSWSADALNKRIGYSCHDGTPYNLAFTYDGSKTVAGINIYINGQTYSDSYVIDSLSGSTASTNPLIFGCWDNWADPFKGKIWYLYIWKRVIHQSEIQQLIYDPYCFIQPIRPSWLKQYVAAGIPKHWDYYRQMRARA